MSMAGQGLVKLVEECGELVEQAMALSSLDNPLALEGMQHALANEIADVHAAILFVSEKFSLDEDTQTHRVRNARQTLDTVAPEDGGRATLSRVAGCLIQQAAKKLSCPDSDEHWDGAGSLTERLGQSMARVTAAAEYVTHTHGLDVHGIHDRAQTKVARFRRWDDAPNH